MEYINRYDFMIGDKILNIAKSEDTLYFLFRAKIVKFYHAQDCCECVYIEDINGDLMNLIDKPLLMAESYTHTGDTEEGTETYTYYTFATTKGRIVIRWHGESNGYYSEEVDMEVFEQYKNNEMFWELREALRAIQIM